MDSKTVNKLIRSEVWPLLRSRGFSKFNARNAWRYREPFVDVVNFQSFNSYLAEGIGCTTFSFAVNVGIYVSGCDTQDHVKRDKTGSILPQEYQCSFREHLKKRSVVDAFQRADIFYIDSEGHSVAAVINEVRYLLTERAVAWFDALGDLDTLISWTVGGSAPPKVPDGFGTGLLTTYGSPASKDLRASLCLLKHEESPSNESAQFALREIDGSIGSIQDVFSPGLHEPPYLETQAGRISSWIRRLDGWLPASDVRPAVLSEHARLLAQSWFQRSDVEAVLFDSPTALSPRSALWPDLRESGFTEFADRLAHRCVSECVQAVAFVPLAPTELRQHKLPHGLFRVAVGVFWPHLAGAGSIRTNHRGEPRPKLNECHVQMWLVPDEQGQGGRTAFSNAASALRALSGDGFAWLKVCASPEALWELLESSDWKIYLNYPMMRGYGSANSLSRHLMLAVLAHLQHRPDLVRDSLVSARTAVLESPDRRRSHLQQWVETVSAGIS